MRCERQEKTEPGELYHWMGGLQIAETLYHEGLEDEDVVRCCYFRERPVMREKERLEKVSEPNSETKAESWRLRGMVKRMALGSNENLPRMT